MIRTNFRRRTERALAPASVLLLSLAAAGCGGPLEGNLPPPVPASPEQMKAAIERTSAGAPKNICAAIWYARWNPPTAPGVGTATPTVSRVVTRNEARKGNVIWNACEVSQIPVPIASQRGTGVTVVDTQTLAVTATIPIKMDIATIVVRPDGTALYLVGTIRR